ncbi:YggS family pyridoxal phosphate enzyme [Candidatus Frankia nodulisporulans]|uniref:YggS family pyridoxal phosphate enzyme n=1 Tax=Candidatus Frankia nodulisporulans TaxID=2060052 RepID=UPI0013D7BDE8|nr:YggS family pyridoxal phosphate enzyme [Candidatus Frankia nodulisporulans]
MTDAARPAPHADEPRHADERRRADLASRLAVVRERIATAAVAAGRDPAELTLVAVSKTYPAEDAVILHTLGLRDFAENREQEARPKVNLVTHQLLGGDAPRAGGPDAGARAAADPAKAASTPGAGLAVPDRPVWHFVGQLQRNKARSVLRWADWVQSVDRAALVDGLSRAAVERGRPLSVCLQISLDPPRASSGADSSGVAVSGRGGIDPGAVSELADLVARAPGLTLRGVMAVAPRGESPRGAFARLRNVAERLVRDHPGATVISAGMSGDLESAIAEGATHLRIGTALFGERPGVP